MSNNLKFYLSWDWILELSPSFRPSLAFYRGGEVSGMSQREPTTAVGEHILGRENHRIKDEEVKVLARESNTWWIREAVD